MKFVKKITKKLRKKVLRNKCISGSLVSLLILSLCTPFVSGNKQDYFVVTAYYSPLPNQQNYLTGNYESEKRLNGQGIRGASGKPVFSGMLAAPKNYKFGTKIELEGLGIGAVEDRGGAIVNAGQRGYSYDRIDVWVGYGDEGLKRALYWGKRKVKGKILSRNTKTTLDYKVIPAPDWATNGLRKSNTLFQKSIGKTSKTSDITALQKFLKEINLYSGELNGDYNTIMEIIYNFQVENNIVSSSNDYGAGYWGKKTRAQFLKKYLNNEFDTKKKENTETQKKEEPVVETQVVIENLLTQEVLDKKLSYFDYPAISKAEIMKLQSILLELGYYQGEVNGNKKDTIDAIFHFQIDNLIVNTQYDIGAGTYGPKTRAKMKEKYEIFLKKQESDRIEKIKGELRKKELEEKMKKIEELASNKAKNDIAKIGKPSFGQKNSSVRELQNILKNLGYFDGNTTGYFGPVTKQSIVSFQVNNKIISYNNAPGAGLVGPKTREVIEKKLYQKYLNIEISQYKEVEKEQLVALLNEV